jgi:hypothetical protein
LIYLKPLSWVRGLIILLNPQRFEIQGPAHNLQVVGKGFDSSCIMPSFEGALSLRLVLEGTIITIVSLIALFLLNALSLLAPVFYPAMCISAVDDVA